MQQIMGMGVDIVEVRRIEALLSKYGQRFTNRLLSLSEQAIPELVEYSNSIRLAGRWAAKEAVSKALGSGFKGFGFYDIEIFNDELGAPQVRLQGGAATRANQVGICSISVSISHEREYAVAMALAFGVTKEE